MNLQTSRHSWKSPLTSNTDAHFRIGMNLGQALCGTLPVPIVVRVFPMGTVGH